MVIIGASCKKLLLILTNEVKEILKENLWLEELTPGLYAVYSESKFRAFLI